MKKISRGKQAWASATKLTYDAGSYALMHQPRILFSYWMWGCSLGGSSPARKTCHGHHLCFSLSLSSLEDRSYWSSTRSIHMSAKIRMCLSTGPQQWLSLSRHPTTHAERLSTSLSKMSATWTKRCPMGSMSEHGKMSSAVFACGLETSVLIKPASPPWIFA